MRCLAALTFLLSSAALAQTTLEPLVLVFPGNTDEQTFSASACGGRTAVNWTATPTQTPCSEMKLWVTAGNCLDTGPLAADYELGSTNLLTQRSGSEAIDFNKLPDFVNNGDGGVFCGSVATRSWRVCGLYETPGGLAGQCSGTSNNGKVSENITLSYDGRPPNQPVITEALGADQAIKVLVDVDEDAASARFAVRPVGDTTDFVFGQDTVVASGTGEQRLGGLVNGTEYEVVAVAIDSAGNISAQSEPAFATPVKTAGFFETYKQAGGTETGGCTAAPGLIGAVGLSLCALWISRRRKS